jgi:hypothetical protein
VLDYGGALIRNPGDEPMLSGEGYDPYSIVRRFVASATEAVKIGMPHICGIG